MGHGLAVCAPSRLCIPEIFIKTEPHMDATDPHVMWNSSAERSRW